jgi:hypothetical protein
LILQLTQPPLQSPNNVDLIERASRLEAAGNNTKHNRVEDRLVLFIEWTVDENTSARRRWHPA